MNHLKINHFKCFEDADIYINRLTVMAGANGNGKSTAIQALLYLRQTIEHCGESHQGNYLLNECNGLNVPLNGVYCLALGNSSFVLNRNYAGNILSLSLFNEQEELTVDYSADNREAQLWLTPVEVHKTEKADFPILMHQFYYLNAERVGPRVNQPLQFSDYPNAGWQGENTAQLMSLEGGYFKIDKERRFENTETYFLQDQLNNWLDFIMKGVKVKVEASPKTLTAQVLIENQFTVSDPTLSTNLGFGISYVLPIIATGLTAKKGSFFIVENPEAHLHPSAQSKIGRFLAMVANAGVNVIIETHSDHIINGLQIAVAKTEVENDLVTINYFSYKEGNVQPDVQPISLSEKGELSDWPTGFFDQTQIDFAELFKLRKV
jgi:predicted ATPase